MSVDAIVKDGSVINQSGAASNSENKAVEKMNDYKEQFMSLLVAQMKYQDPLEPTSNTEYISHYAQFTQVEQMQNMADAMTLNRASEMVGKTVQIEDTNDDGVKFVKDTGKVDYVTYSAGDAYVHVNGNSYKVSQVSSVLDDKYYSDVETSDEIRNMMKKLPDVQSLTLSSQADLESLLQRLAFGDHDRDRRPFHGAVLTLVHGVDHGVVIQLG